MFWVDKIAKEIIESGKYKPYLVDDGKTPSGFAHIGSLRGPVIHDLLFKALKDNGVEIGYCFVIYDFDPVDSLPDELKKDFEKYMGFPLKTVPSPNSKYNSLADYFSTDFKEVLEGLGIKPEYVSAWELYHQGKFDEAIRQALDKADVILEIYKEVSGSKKDEKGWLPLQVICENCGKLGTTRVYDWNGETVAYKCEEELVMWAKGCGKEGRISPFGGKAKLPWKVDWPAHWKVLGITVEGAGKDHSSKGGSRDIARELCKKVFKIEEPFDVPYEHFQVGGKKMSSSKGIGLKAHDLIKILPNEISRFLFCRSDYKVAIDFNPSGTMAIPDLFDEYDKCYRAYLNGDEPELGRIFELSQINNLPQKEKTFIPRFRDVVNFIQQSGIDIYRKFEEIKKDSLNETEKKLLKERIDYAKIWLQDFSPEEQKLQMSRDLPEIAKNLTLDQKKFIENVIPLVQTEDDPEKLQLKMYELSKQMKLDAKSAFGGIYISMIGKEHGPKASAFLLQYPKDQVIKRLQEAAR